MEAGGCSFGQDFEFGRDRAGKLAAVCCSSTGCDCGDCSVICEEVFELRQGQERLLEIVEAELEERRLFDDGVGFFEHLGGCGAYDGDADFAYAGTEKLWGYGGHIRSHVYNRGILQTLSFGCKFLLK